MSSHRIGKRTEPASISLVKKTNSNKQMLAKPSGYTKTHHKKDTFVAKKLRVEYCPKSLAPDIFTHPLTHTSHTQN